MPSRQREYVHGTFDVPWRQHQTDAALPGVQHTQGLEQQGFFRWMCAAGDNRQRRQRDRGELPRRQRQRRIRLQAADDERGVCVGPDRDIPIAINGGPCTDGGDASKDVREEAAHEAISRHIGRAQPRIYHDQRDVEPVRRVKQVRPDLGFDDDHRRGRDSGEPALDPASIPRQIGDGVHGRSRHAECFCCVKSSSRARREHDTYSPCRQFVDQGDRRVDFAERHGVEQDGRRGVRRHGRGSTQAHVQLRAGGG